MASKRREAGPNQGMLLEHSNHDGMDIVKPGEVFGPLAEELTPRIADLPVEYGEPGSYIDIAERARNLKAALSSFSQSNHNEGLSRVVGYKEEVRKRYKGEADKRQKNAETDAKEFFKIAKQYFWKAAGHAALRTAGLVSPSEADSQVNEMWGEFAIKYSKPGQDKKRRKLVSQLDKSIERVKKTKADIN